MKLCLWATQPVLRLEFILSILALTLLLIAYSGPWFSMSVGMSTEKGDLWGVSCVSGCWFPMSSTWDEVPGDINHAFKITRIACISGMFCASFLIVLYFFASCFFSVTSTFTLRMVRLAIILFSAVAQCAAWYALYKLDSSKSGGNTPSHNPSPYNPMGKMGDITELYGFYSFILSTIVIFLHLLHMILCPYSPRIESAEMNNGEPGEKHHYGEKSPLLGNDNHHQEYYSVSVEGQSGRERLP